MFIVLLVVITLISKLELKLQIKMGQRIFYIIAKGDIEVPIDIVSFIEKDATIIPLDIDESIYEGLSKLCEDFKTLDNLYKAFPSVLGKGFYFIKDIQLKNFAVLGLREILEIPHPIGNPIIFIDGKIIKTKDTNPQWGHDLLNIDFSFGELIRKEKRYWTFASAEKDYFKIIENLLPPTWYKNNKG